MERNISTTTGARVSYGLRINDEMQPEMFGEDEEGLTMAKRACKAHTNNGAWKAEVMLADISVYVCYDAAALAARINNLTQVN